LKPQNNENHVRLIPAFHFFLVPLGLITLAAAIVYLILSINNGDSLFASLLFVCLSLMMVMTMIFSRIFACTAQDRAIRSEENLRHFVLTGKLLDPKLTMNQIIALRFASDDEFPSLCEKAVKECISPDAIKQDIQAWKADYYRV
jgi:FlaA1/EpsC-like NDP-sugar epimerase